MLKKGKKLLKLLKMVILVKRENLIKATQSYEYVVSLIFKEKMQVPFTLLLFWITQGSHLLREQVDIFYPKKKHTAFCKIRNCMLKRDMEFRPFYLFLKAICL